MTLKELFFGENTIPPQAPALVDNDAHYKVTTYEGHVYDVPGAWVNNRLDNEVFYRGQYIYIDWGNVESVRLAGS